LVAAICGTTAAAAARFSNKHMVPTGRQLLFH
jgi:hypothetical protein